jgi:hypothetical protein
MQLTLISLSLVEIYEDKITFIAIMQLNPFILIARLFAAMILHMGLVQNVNAGLERMKYAVNHDYMFAN